MAAEIGSMRISEQIDALVSFGAEPSQHLVMPRVLAGLLMTPIMTMVFNVVGLVGAYLVAVHLRHVDPGGVLHTFRFYTDPLDYLEGAIKATAFGIAFTLVACYQGFNVRGGARELGRATTNAVVEGAVAILVLDYFLTDVMLVIWPPRRYSDARAAIRAAQQRREPDVRDETLRERVGQRGDAGVGDRDRRGIDPPARLALGAQLGAQVAGADAADVDRAEQVPRLPRAVQQLAEPGRAAAGRRWRRRRSAGAPRPAARRMRTPAARPAARSSRARRR